MGLYTQGLPLHSQSSAPQSGVIVEFVMTVCVVFMVGCNIEVDVFRTGVVGMCVVPRVDIWSVV